MKFSFVSGNPALDLTGTMTSRRHDPVDLLKKPSALEEWLTACAETPDGLTVDSQTFEATLSLREAVYRLALDRIANRSFDPGSLDIINHVASNPPLELELSDGGLRISGTTSSTLSFLARSGIIVLADPQSQIKECGRAGCTRIYLDRSHGARRTWCGMDACGNRVKAAAYRSRKRAGHTRGSTSHPTA